MYIKVLREAGYNEALLGLSLSYNQPVEKMPDVALKLCNKDDGHNKFLESMAVWLDVRAPRYWWQQFDAYRVGVTKQSESTMHTVLRRALRQEDFEVAIHPQTLSRLNLLIEGGFFDTLKGELPESFLQRRIVCINYKALRHIIKQRAKHRLSEWRFFCNAVLGQLEHREFFERAE